MPLSTSHRSRFSSPPPTTTTSQLTPSLSRLSPPPPSPPKPHLLKFLRTFFPRPLPTSDTCGPNAQARELSLRAAARALRRWFGSPPSPSSGKTEEQAEYKRRYLEKEKEWEAFLRSVEDDQGGPPLSPVSPRRVGQADNERPRRRSDSKSSDWDAAMLAHARSLRYSCPSSPFEFGSNSSFESLASGSSGWSSSTHTSSRSVFSSSNRTATHYSPMRRRSSLGSDSDSDLNGGGEAKRSITSEDFVAQYFAGAGPSEGSMLEGIMRMSNPGPVDAPRRSGAQCPEQQQKKVEVEPRPRRETETLSPGTTGPTFVGSVTPVSRTISTASLSVADPPSLPLRSPRDTVLAFRPPSPAQGRARSPTQHRTFRPSPLRSRTLSSAGHEVNERCEDPPTDLDTLRVWKSKRRRNTTDGLTTIWETGSHRESALNSVVVEFGSEAEG